jgi:hypothetical protein
MVPIRSAEKSVRKQPTLRNIPEDDRIQVYCSGSLRSRKMYRSEVQGVYDFKIEGALTSLIS